MRVVSLLPSATELLCAIGGRELLVGRSHECDYPDAIRDRPVLTRQRTHSASSRAIDAQVRESLGSGESLYELDVAQLQALRPDIILTQDLCNVCSIDLGTVQQIASTLNPKPEILSLNPRSIEDVFDDLLVVGDAVELQSNSQRAMVELRGRYWEARDFVNPYLDGPKVVFIEWMDPLFVAGHWTPGLIRDAGGTCSLSTPGDQSKQVSVEALIASQPQRIIICPCGFSIDETKARQHELTDQPWWPTLPAVQHNAVVIVDGNQMFSRPGPRLVDAFCWLAGWLNNRPELVPTEFPVEAVVGASSI